MGGGDVAAIATSNDATSSVSYTDLLSFMTKVSTRLDALERQQQYPTTFPIPSAFSPAVTPNFIATAPVNKLIGHQQHLFLTASSLDNVISKLAECVHTLLDNSKPIDNVTNDTAAECIHHNEKKHKNQQQKRENAIQSIQESILPLLSTTTNVIRAVAWELVVPPPHFGFGTLTAPSLSAFAMGGGDVGEANENKKNQRKRRKKMAVESE